MRQTEKEMLELYNNADEQGKATIMDILLCATTCGEDFFREMSYCLDNCTVEETRATLNKWIAQVKKAGAMV